MKSDAEARWALAVRVLAVIAVLLLVVTVVEARALRRARSDIEQLRRERDAVKVDVESAWARQSIDDVRRAIGWLDAFYREPSEGFGRTGGLCSGGALDDAALVTSVFGTFLPARAAGTPVQASLALMRNALVRSDAYRAIHPGRGPARGAGRQ